MALVALILGVYLIVDGGGKRWETVGSFRSNNGGLDRPGAGIGDVDGSVGEWIILWIEHFSVQQAPDGLFFLIGGGTRDRPQNQQQRAGENDGLHRGAFVFHVSDYCLTAPNARQLMGKVQSSVFPLIAIDMYGNRLN